MVCCMCIYQLCFRPFSPDGGTLAPFFLASERPIATACLRLLTFFPLRPLFSLPRFILCIASSTCFRDRSTYLAIGSIFIREDPVFLLHFLSAIRGHVVAQAVFVKVQFGRERPVGQPLKVRIEIHPD